MRKYSNEALKRGIKPSKPVEQMTKGEIDAFRNALDPDMMGFDGQEGMMLDETDK